jgi:Leucine-rich repeat (LRR) protein
MSKLSSVQQQLSEKNQLLLGGQMLGMSCIEELLELPDFLGVGLLHLGGNYIGDEGVSRLVSSATVCNIEELNLTQNNLSVHAARSIASSPNLSKLSKLNLCNNYLGDKGVQALMQAFSVPSIWIQFLQWIFPPPKKEFVKVEATDPYRSHYQEREEKNPHLTPHTNNTLPSLTWLDLGWNKLTDEGAENLVSSPFLRQLSYLNLQNNQLSYEGICVLIESYFLEGSLIINASGNPISFFDKERLRKKAGERLRI